ncbi:hypothetical protein PHMEG_00021420 [Phytophthora megakarya]|uniref:Uncharacterized protein n=1 Tax=Phytophthora megakarya TaxID=4795 RepID=A0A225VN59_9STRA|nr:hypothetical protein PHMEG_00021420 [Phytophthora megakarya]
MHLATPIQNQQDELSKLNYPKRRRDGPGTNDDVLDDGGYSSAANESDDADSDGFDAWTTPTA